MGDRDGRRGQMSLDFAIGAVVFLLAAGVVIGLVPSLIPAVGDNPADVVVADRVADQLAHDELAAPGQPYVLNDSATRAFFDAGASEAHDRLALDTSVRLNVTVTTATGRRTLGPTPPNTTDSVYPARRVVTLDGDQRILRVSVW